MIRIDSVNTIYKQLCARALIGGEVSINDLREWEINGKDLTSEQKKALQNFDAHRIKELQKQKSDYNYHNKYIELQVMANLSPFEEFLKEKYQRL